MNMAGRKPFGGRGLDESRIFNILWLSGTAFCAALLMMLLLQRLGVPMNLMSGTTTIWVSVSIFILAWFGRTMTSYPFFYAGRLAGSAPLGLGGLNDWLGGAFLILFFSASLTGKIILAPSLMLGILLQATLFTVAFHRSGVATLPGFFAWRSQSQLAGLIVLLVVIAILSLLIIAEFTVAVDMFARITQITHANSIWFVVVLSVLPALIGGWSSLIIVNGVLAAWLMICVLTPALITGFFRGFLRAGLDQEVNGHSIQQLQATGEQVLGLSSGDLAGGELAGEALAGGNANVLILLTTALVLSTGFSVLPHALSRLSLSKHQISAIEGLGWSALAAFLVLSALPLSIGLIGVNPSSSTLALLLKSQPVLHLLPYMALLFAAFNAMSATLFALSSAVVRAFRRSRNLNPGEQSIFSTRLLAVLVAACLIVIPSNQIPTPGALLIMALSLSAGALFIPMVASIWLSSIPRTALILAVIAGAGVVVTWVFLMKGNITSAGALGMAAGSGVVLLGRIFTLIRKPRNSDLRLADIRQT